MAGPMAGLPAAPAPGPAAYRLARESDLEGCAQLHKAAVDDYQARLAQPAMPDDLLPLRRLLAHLLSTDPDRFWVATVRDAGGGEQLAGFASATVREGLWFLAMLFVRPGIQAAGLGQALMDRAQAGRDVDPGGPAVPGPDDAQGTGIHTWGMCTDAAQPISNALYARRGMVPRIPAWRLIGEVRRWSAVPPLPDTLEAVPFDAIAAAEPDGERRLADLVDTLDPALHPALLGVAVRETPMLGAVAMWVPGTADIATRALLHAGLRLDGFPGLICWSRRDHPFERYIPVSLALV
jgi:GNAT superfamily N-acetyltransferase